MVSTRRTAHKEPELDSTARSDGGGQTLRKPAVRRATAKKQEEAEPKAKLTRARKANASSEAVTADKHAIEAVELPLQARPTRKVGRPKKPARELVAEEPALTKPIQATKATASRKTKPIATSRKLPVAPAAEKPRPTRRTRATTIDNRSLSPKKTTEVARARTRSTRTQNGTTTTTKEAPIASTMTGDRTTLDEYAEATRVAQVQLNEDDGLLSSPPGRCSRTRKQIGAKSHAASSISSMSSRPTTPSDSPLPHFDKLNNEYEHRRRNNPVSETHPSEDEPESQEEQDESEDELCGAKTPMKRSGTGHDDRYIGSIQKSVYRTGRKTPMKSPSAFTSRLNSVCTPQTLKRYRQQALPASEVKLSNMGRGGTKASVSRDQNAAREVDEGIPEGPISDSIVDLLPEADASSSDICEPGFDTHSPPPPEARMPPGHLESEAKAAVTNNGSLPQDEDAPLEDNPDETVPVDDMAPAGVATPTAQWLPTLSSCDTEHTIPTDENIGNSPHREQIEGEEDVAASPETLIWANVEHDTAIAVDFDGHFFGPRSLPQVEPTECLSIAASWSAFVPPTIESAMMVEPGQNVASHKSEVEFSGPQGRPHGVIVDWDSFDATVNLNDFIDVGALAEPTQAIDLSLNRQDIGEVPSHSGSMEQIDTAESMLGSRTEDGPETMLSSQSSEEDCFDLREGETPVIVAADDSKVSPELDRLEQHALGSEPACKQASEEGVVAESETPHYALPTLAFDARRKSMPTFGPRTPANASVRPSTSDGASIWREACPFGQPWWVGSRAGSTNNTPRTSPRRAHESSKTTADNGRTSPTSPKPSTAPNATPTPWTKERFPRLLPREDYQEHVKTAGPPTRFRTPTQSCARRPVTTHKPSANAVTPRKLSLRPRQEAQEGKQVEEPSSSLNIAAAAPSTPIESPSVRQPRLPLRQIHQHARTIAAPSRFRTPMKSALKRPATAQKSMMAAPTPETLLTGADSVVAVGHLGTPQVTIDFPCPAMTPSGPPGERYPRLAPQKDYAEHAHTVAAPARFRTPTQSPQKRAESLKKPTSLRKTLAKTNSSRTVHTPMKTPLKPPATTPSQAPMTPHPAAPLRGVVAMVEVFTLEGASASTPFIALLHRLGAKTSKSWTDRITHVVFKDGSPLTLSRIRLHNKDVEENGGGEHIHCVNSRWVTDCDSEGTRVDEADEAYAVDVAEVPRGGGRRRKSMEPSALVNIGGIVVRDRKSSLGRSSLGRSPFKFDLSTEMLGSGKEAATKAESVDKENVEDTPSSPATPDYLAAPDKLIQQTAPIKRVRRLGLKAQGSAKNRRLTFFPTRV